MDRRRWIVSAACAAIGWPAAGLASQTRAWLRQRLTPAVHLQTLDGTPWTLASQRGHPVLLNFWASWCEPCRSELPLLEKSAAAWREAGLRVMAVNFREGEPAVRRYLATNPLSLPVLRDADGSAARAFGVNIFPSTVAINRKGRVLVIEVGELEAGDALRLIHSVI